MFERTRQQASLWAVLALAFSGAVVFGQQPDPTSPPPSKEELKKQKKEKKKAAKEAAEAAREASDHIALPLEGKVTWTFSGEQGCVMATGASFNRDVVRGWGGLLNGGNNAFLGVTSSLRGTAKNVCPREVTVAIYADFYDSSGVQLGSGFTQILISATGSNSFEVPWSCADGMYYQPMGSSSTVWVPRCAADTARYSVAYR